ncbi:MAG: maleate cis-trans isomerase [Proteobacteria bacterium]|nr:maleate cis-trans isomerase [Pseudomonadota bacterium]
MLPKIEHRVGLLIPSSNTNIEPEYYAVMPRSVSLHFGRLIVTKVDDEGLALQDRDVDYQAKLLGTARVEVILFCQTAASWYLGLDYDARLRSRIEAASGRPALTAAKTILDALQALGVGRVALATPFIPEVNAVSTRFLEGAGLKVVAAEGLGMTDNFSIVTLKPDTLLDLARRADRPEAEAIIMPGGNMPCLAIAERAESELGKPVVTTNMAGIWALLRHLGVAKPIQGFGRLLRERMVA